MKSEKVVKGPSLFASRIASIAATPTFLIAENPKRIALSTILKLTSLSLISGGKTLIFILRHSLTAKEIFSLSADSAVKKAAINSTGKFAFI